MVYAFLIFVSCLQTRRCQNQLNTHQPSQQGDFGVFVCRGASHPFLSDHDRTLAVFSGSTVIDVEVLHSSPGGRLPVHFVQGTPHWTVVDVNGMHYAVDQTGIRTIGWKWMAPLPPGPVKKLSANNAGFYVITETVGEPSLDDIYTFKDRP